MKNTVGIEIQRSRPKLIRFGEIPEVIPMPLLYQSASPAMIEAVPSVVMIELTPMRATRL
jgi:hypothetical protein